MNNKNKFILYKTNTTLFSKFYTKHLLATVFSLSFSMLHAQTPTNDDASIVTYDKTYFEAYAPVTLLDMLQRVPGAPEILNKNRQQRGGGGGGGGGANNQGERGFGSGGDQILIDGKRLAGKANNIDDTLGRISAAQVERVELIRGAASGLDVQSQGLVINIVLAEGASTSTTFWKLTSETKAGHAPGFEALVSHSGSLGKLDYTFTAERTSNNGYVSRDEIFYDADGVRTGEKDIDAEFNFRGFNFNTNLTYNFEDGAVLRLNGLFEPNSMKGEEPRIETGDVTEYILWSTKRDFDKWEVGGDYTRELGALGNLKALFVINQNKENDNVDRFTGATSVEFQNIRESEIEDKREKIIRASITRGITSAQTIEIGAEAAINTFNKKFDRFERDFASDPLAFQVDESDNVEIQENRYEIFGNHTYNFSSSLVLQSSLITEFSKIVADNIFADGTTSRRDTSFTYFKPRANLRYDINPQNQIRATVEKKVSQLDFDNFVAEFDQRAEQFRVGNTDIRPEQVWEFSATYEHRLANDAGSFEAELFYRRYTDYITMVDFTEYQNLAGDMIGVEEFFALPPTQVLRDIMNDGEVGAAFISATGNVDKATSYGVRAKGSLRLGFVGLPQATLSANYTYEDTNVIDQFTFNDRVFDRVSPHKLDIDFRHDVTEWGFSYGFSGSFESDGATYDVDYYWPYSPQANLKVFAEYQILDGIKVRLDAKQLTGRRGFSNRFNYTDQIRFDELSDREEKRTYGPREFEISVQGTF